MTKKLLVQIKNEWRNNLWLALELLVVSVVMIDLNASWKFKIGALDAVFSGNVNNLLNYQYIEKAWNPKGKVATDENVYVFYTLGRTYSLRLRVNF